MSNDLQIVFGATGAVGGALVAELVSRGKRVRAVNRTRTSETWPGVEAVLADATDAAQARGAARGGAVIYNCLFPVVMEPLIEASEAEGATLVFADNLYMYDPTRGLLSEELPNEPGHRRDGQGRAQLADTLMSAHRDGRAQAVIARASDLYGPGVTNSALGERGFGPALTAGSVNVLDDPDTPHTYTYIADFANALATLAEHPDTAGQVWHVPSAETITTREFLNLVFAEARTQPKIRAAGGALLAALSLFSPTMRDLRREKAYQFEAPWIVDHTKYETRFGAQVTPHRQAIRQTLEWYRARPGSPTEAGPSDPRRTGSPSTGTPADPLTPLTTRSVTHDASTFPDAWLHQTRTETQPVPSIENDRAAHYRRTR